jgi:hypothetical protein
MTDEATARMTQDEANKFLREPNELTEAELENRRGAIPYPGFINLLNDRGSFAGCVVREFQNVEQVNDFFRARQGLLAISITPLAVEHPEDGTPYSVVYTKTLSDEDTELLSEFQLEFNEFREKKKADRLVAAAKEAEAQKKAEDEMHRLIALGRACESGNHSGLADENRALKKAAKKGK